MNTCIQLWMRRTHRALALLVLCLVAVFPAYKGRYITYVPMAFVAIAVIWAHSRLAQGWVPLRNASRATFVFFAWVLPALVQLISLLFMRPEPRYDGLFVFEQAVAFYQTGEMPPLTYYPPAQHWYYAAWFALFGPSVLVAQMSQIPLHALVTWLTLGIARRLAPVFARAAALVVAWYPSFLFYVLTTPYYHYLYTASVLATAWGWLAAFERPRNAFLAGLASGWGALAKAVQLIAPAQAVFFWMLASIGSQQNWLNAGLIKRVLLFVAGMIVVIAPWTYRNWLVFRDWVPICTSGGLVLLSANSPDSNGLYSPLPDRVEISTPREMLAHSRACAAQAKAYIRENPKRFFQVAGIKLLHTWGGEATFAELINFRGHSLVRAGDTFRLLFFSGWVMLTFFWAGSILRGSSRPSVDAMILSVIASNMAVYMVFEGGDRHHLPFVPLLAITSFASWTSRRLEGQ